MAEYAEVDVAAIAGVGVLVAGAGTAGRSAARHLAALGAEVTVADARFGDETDGELAAAGVSQVSVDALHAARLDPFSLVIVSPGFAPSHPLISRLSAAGLPVWGEVELAWRIDRSGLLGPQRTWLVVTGTNGKTTTTSMLADIVSGAGRAAMACGNIGLPVLDAMNQLPRVDVLCVEMSSFQLYWAPSVAPDAGVVLNVAQDHLDWHGSFDAYAQAKAIALHGAVGVVGLDDPVASALPVLGRRVGFTLGDPRPGELGVGDGMLVDRAFGDDGAGRDLVEASAIHPAGPSGVADALAAASLALAAGLTPREVGTGLRAFRPAAHRGEVVARVAGVDYVDDSKATNPHAAHAAIRGHRRVVLVAGGLLKGAAVDDVVRDTRDRLAGVVAIGRDRDLIIEAIARHAPEVPAVTVFTGDDGRVTVQHPSAPPETDRNAGFAPMIPAHALPPRVAAEPAHAVMARAVEVAAQLAERAEDRPDAVLLAPAAASLDMFAGYGVRGDAFADAARALPGARPAGGSSR